MRVEFVKGNFDMGQEIEWEFVEGAETKEEAIELLKQYILDNGASEEEIEEYAFR